MDLEQVGIGLSYRCGANMSANLAGVLFDDRGRIKISGSPIQCSRCGAIYRPGERLKYKLLFSNGGTASSRKMLDHGLGLYAPS